MIESPIDRRCQLWIVYEGALDARSHGGASAHFIGLSKALSKLSDLQVLLPAYGGQLRGWNFSGANVRVTGLRVPEKSVIALILYELRKAVFLASALRRSHGKHRRTKIFMSRLGLLGFSLAAARLLGYTTVVEVNGWPPDEFAARGLNRILRRLVTMTSGLQVRCADALVCVTPEIAKRTGAARERIVILPNAADIRPYLERGVVDKCSLSGTLLRRRLRIVFAGALVSWQDLPTVLRAMATANKRSDAWSLDIFGEGEDRRELEALANALGVSDLVTWHGWVHPRELRDKLPRFDVGLVPLRSKGTSEACGSPLKLFEYIAAGLRVVASSVDGVRELGGSVPLALYDEGDASGLERAIQEAISWPPMNAAEISALIHSVSWDARASELVAELVTATDSKVLKG